MYVLCLNSLNSYNSLLHWVPLPSPFCRWGSWAQIENCNMSKVTQLLNAWTAHRFQLWNPQLWPLLNTMDKLHKLSGPQFLHLSDGDSNASRPAQSFMLRYEARIDTKWRVTMPMANTQRNPHVWLPWGWLYPESGAWPGPKGRFWGVRMRFGRLFWREQGWLQLTLMRSQTRQTSSLGLFPPHERCLD